MPDLSEVDYRDHRPLYLKLWHLALTLELVFVADQQKRWQIMDRLDARIDPWIEAVPIPLKKGIKHGSVTK